MDLFELWFIQQLLGINLDEDEAQMLKQLYSHLIESAAQPQVVVHKDFHSRNLMLLENNSLGVIDFQDAVVGPVTYDLVSLLKDCYLHLDADKVEERALNYKRQLESAVCSAKPAIRIFSAALTRWACNAISRCWAYLPGSVCGMASQIISMIFRW